MEIIIFLIIIWLFLTIIKKILMFLFGHNNNQKTSAYNVESDGSKSPDLKYKNAVYTSFKDKVYKAFETLKKEEYPVTWALDDAGFIVPISGSIFEGSEVYETSVRFDDKNRFTSKDPYYILVAYGVLFKNSDLDYYKEMSEYLNKYIYKELKKPGIFFNLDYVEDTDFRILYCNLIISDSGNSYEEPRKLSEADEFKRLFNEAKQAYHEGVELYRFRD